MYIGSWKIDDNITFVLNTTRFDTGAATDADSAPLYHVYEDEIATPLVTGTMALLNGANTIGFYSEQITLSAANGFEKGKSYSVYIQATVNSVVAATHRTFQIEAEVDANVVSDKTGYSLSSPQNFNLIGNITGTFVGNINGVVQSVTNPVIVGSATGTFFNDVADFVWDEQLSGHLVAGSAGHTLSSRMPTGTVVVGTNQDKTGYSLSSPQSFDLIGNVSGTLINVLNVINPVIAGMVTGSVLGNVNGSVGSVVSPVGISTGTFIQAIADQVWDETLSGHLLAGSTGFTLNSAGSAGDPWGTSLPGAYGTGTAGNILGNRLDIAVGSRMPSGTVVVATNQDKTGYSLATGTNIPANVKQINDTNVTGNGSSTPWGPA